MGAKRKKQDKNEKNQLVMSGIRKGGESDFEIKISGDPASQFPPLILRMTLHEMQQWLVDTRTPPEPVPGKRPSLRLVS